MDHEAKAARDAELIAQDRLLWSQAKEPPIALNSADLKIDTYRSGSDLRVLVTHLPSGLAADSGNSSSYIAAHNEAMRKLRERISDWTTADRSATLHSARDNPRRE